MRLCSSHGLELITVLKEEKKEQAFLSALLHVDGSCVPACPPFLYTPTLCSNKGTVNHITWAREQTARRSAGPSLSFKLAAVRDYELFARARIDWQRVVQLSEHCGEKLGLL